MIAPWKTDIVSSFTGPCGGLTQLDLLSDQFPKDPEEVAGAKDWNRPSDVAYGISLSLYEDDKTRQKVEIINGIPQVTSTLVGDPVADVFGVIARENSAVLAVADGVGWGKKPRLAARCAVRAVMDHFASNIRRLQTRSSSSRTVLEMLMESVKAAQKSILDHRATLTTLSVAVLCEMQKSSRSAAKEWGMFVISIGDSPVYVYCPHTQQVFEATIGCHSHDGVRDMRMAGGSLGPARGTRPDLGNLTLAYMPMYQDDIVFIASDGISDNFSSYVNHQWSTDNEEMESSGENEEVIRHPQLDPSLQPCYDNIVHLTSTLKKHHDDIQHHLSAQTVTACLMNYAVELTEKKRQFMSDCRLKGIEVKMKMKEDPGFAGIVNQHTGKLDHATVVAYQVRHR